MQYLKKPDGTIQQYEDDMKQALQLDKELYAQRGEEFGEVYDADSLPDEDKIKIGIMTQKEYEAKQKEILKQKEASDYEVMIQAELRAMAIERIEAKKVKL